MARHWPADHSPMVLCVRMLVPARLSPARLYALMPVCTTAAAFVLPGLPQRYAPAAFVVQSRRIRDAIQQAGIHGKWQKQAKGIFRLSAPVTGAPGWRAPATIRRAPAPQPACPANCANRAAINRTHPAPLATQPRSRPGCAPVLAPGGQVKPVQHGHFLHGYCFERIRSSPVLRGKVPPASVHRLGSAALFEFLDFLFEVQFFPL